jgi:hypothetical protein
LVVADCLQSTSSTGGKNYRLRLPLNIPVKNR